MCTIAILHRVHPDHPLIVAANRDEMYARAALPPERDPDDPRVIAGVDCEHGGTWMGAHESGLFVGITNQRTWGSRAPAPRSRGQIARDALHAGSRDAVRAMVESLDARDHNSFNLVWGDASGVSVAYGRRERARATIEDLPEGVHVLVNDRIGSADFPKADRVAELLRALPLSRWDDDAAALRRVLADHALPPLAAVPAPPPDAPITHELARALQAVCIHTPFYGTRSSTLIALDEDRVAHYAFADGPPCTTAHRPVLTSSR